jgi:subtilisin family serine protease
MTATHLLAALSDRLKDMQQRAIEPVEVAILDSGIDASHPDLQGRVAATYRIDMEEDVPVIVEVESGGNNDRYGHGTAVAHIITSLAPNTRLIDIRVLGEHNQGTATALVAGLRLVVRRKWRLINMSLAISATFTKRLFPLCEQAYYQNQVIVAAKRNMPITDQGFPAEYSSCISVEDKCLLSPFTYHYRSDKVIEYVAHGEGVVVARPGGGYTTMTGTSFATATITGICALLVGAYPQLRPFEVKTLLTHFATDDPANPVNAGLAKD